MKISGAKVWLDCILPPIWGQLDGSGDGFPHRFTPKAWFGSSVMLRNACTLQCTMVFFVHTVHEGYTYSCVQHKERPACHLRRLLRSLMRAILCALVDPAFSEYSRRGPVRAFSMTKPEGPCGENLYSMFLRLAFGFLDH